MRHSAGAWAVGLIKHAEVFPPGPLLLWGAAGARSKSQIRYQGQRNFRFHPAHPFKPARLPGLRSLLNGSTHSLEDLKPRISGITRMYRLCIRASRNCGMKSVVHHSPRFGCVSVAARLCVRHRPPGGINRLQDPPGSAILSPVPPFPIFVQFRFPAGLEKSQRIGWRESFQ